MNLDIFSGFAICIFGIVISVFVAFYFKKWNVLKSFVPLKFPALSEYRNMFSKNVRNDYFLMIIISGVLGTVCGTLYYFVFDLPLLHSLCWELAAGIIVPISYIDLQKKIIPNVLIIVILVSGAFFLIASIVYSFIYGIDMFEVPIDRILGLLFAFFVFMLARYLSKGNLGAGDVKLFTALGFLLGVSPIINIAFYTLVSSAVVAVYFLVTKKKNLKDSIPIGPFVIVGIIICIVLGV